MSARRQCIAANWKMHGTAASIQSYLEALVGRVAADGPEVVVCPPYTLLPAAAMIAAGSAVAIGGQSCHWEEKGAFTGEIAPAMLAELGVTFVVVGHSERRQYFGETDATAAARARAAQAAGLTVIFCLGETLEQREAGSTFAVLERQSAVLAGLDPALLTVAYEPVWAIGTGRNATPEQAQEAHAFLRARLAALLGILGQADVDGALVGGASLDAASFWAIIQGSPACGGV